MRGRFTHAVLVLALVGAVLGGAVGPALAQQPPAPNGTNTAANTTTSAATGSSANTATAPTANGTSQRTPDVTVRSAADLAQAAENAPAGANVYIPSDADITATG
jgi:hypothetical protein